MKDQRLAERCQRLKLVLSDVDGVMTDGTVLLLPVESIEHGARHLLSLGAEVVVLEPAALRRALVDQLVARMEVIQQIQKSLKKQSITQLKQSILIIF